MSFFITCFSFYCRDLLRLKSWGTPSSFIIKRSGWSSSYGRKMATTDTNYCWITRGPILIFPWHNFGSLPSFWKLHAICLQSALVTNDERINRLPLSVRSLSVTRFLLEFNICGFWHTEHFAEGELSEKKCGRLRSNSIRLDDKCPSMCVLKCTNNTSGLKCRKSELIILPINPSPLKNTHYIFTTLLPVTKHMLQ